VSWDYEIDDRALQELKKLDRNTQRRIIRFLDERIAHSDNPQVLGKPLKGKLATYWRYRVGDYRLICHLQQRKLLVVVIAIGHRREVYR